MNKILFMNKVLPRLQEGRFFKSLFSWAIKVLSIVIGLGCLVLWISAWSDIIHMDIGEIIGGLIFQIIFVVAVYAVIHTMWIRSENINSLTLTDLKIIPIVTITLRMLGEVLAIFILFVSIGGGIFIWFAGQHISHLIWMPYELSLFTMDGSSFFIGLVFMVNGVIASLVALISYYLLSEMINLFVGMSEQLKAIRRSTQK